MTDKLHESARSLPIGHLHLPIRAHNALKRAGFTTVGQLFDLTDDQLRTIRQFGPSNVAAVRQGKQAFLTQLADAEDMDEPDLWRKLDIHVVPGFVDGSTTARDIISAFSRLIEELLSMQKDERLWIIIKRRYGLDGSQQLTLEEIGLAYGLSRERVRQLEARTLKLLRRELLGDSAGSKDFRLHPLVQEALQPIAVFVDNLLAQAILESALIEQIETMHNVETRTSRPSLFLLFDLLGLRRITFDREGLEPLWGILTIPESRSLSKRVTLVDKLFTEENALPLSEIDILIQLNQRLKKSQRFDMEQLGQLLPHCSTIEMIDPATYWAKFEHIKSRTNQVERILFEQGEPMHSGNIAREINRRMVTVGKQPINARNLVNQMSGDKRFTTIGKTGEWGLSDWSMETSTVLELMRQFLIVRNEAATADEIYAYVSSRRSVRRNSIEYYLTFRDEFGKIGRTQWGLAHWAEASDAQTWNVEQVGQFVEDLFRKNRAKKLEYAILCDALIEASQVKPRTARGMLNINPVIKTERDANGTVFAIFQPQYRQILAEDGVRTRKKRTTLKSKTSERVRVILEETPDNQIALAALVEKLVREFQRRDKTFYLYISRLDYVEKFKDPMSGTMMVRLKQVPAPLQFPAVGEIRSAKRRESVERALSFLNENDVDVALFFLSKEFEAALKSYLNSAHAEGLYPTLPEGRLSLDRMINFIKKEGVITDQAILSYLRQKRNERAHGRMPTIEERQVLMKNSEYIAGLYIDYIKLFDGLEHGLT